MSTLFSRHCPSFSLRTGLATLSLIQCKNWACYIVQCPSFSVRTGFATLSLIQCKNWACNTVPRSVHKNWACDNFLTLRQVTTVQSKMYTEQCPLSTSRVIILKIGSLGRGGGGGNVILPSNGNNSGQKFNFPDFITQHINFIGARDKSQFW